MNWIDVKTRLPSEEECKKNCGWFLVQRTFETRAGMSRYDEYEKDPCYSHGWKYGALDREITHWMPLPDIPEKES